MCRYSFTSKYNRVHLTKAGFENHTKEIRDEKISYNIQHIFF
jgi:hypothetical protein